MTVPGTWYAILRYDMCRGEMESRPFILIADFT